MEQSSLSMQYHQLGKPRDLTCNIRVFKPVDQDIIRRAELRRNLRGDPPYMCMRSSVMHVEANAEAVFDTGATRSCISPPLAESFGEPSNLSATLGTVNGDQNRQTVLYTVGLCVLGHPRTLVLPAVQVVAAKPAGTDALIGMDILGQIKFCFEYNGDEKESTFTLDFP